MRAATLILPLTAVTTANAQGAGMRLRLQFPPTPEFAAKHAELAVTLVKNAERVTLDYSPGSLKTVDAIIQRLRANKVPPDTLTETMFLFGCYAGEVVVRNKRAVWANSADVMDKKMAEFFPFMVVKMLPNGKVWNPIGKAFKELESGEVDSLEYLYEISDQP